MSQLTVNGMELSLPISPEAPFQELIQFFRQNFSSETVLISSVRVDGAEISIPEEAKLARVPISQLKTVEIFTVHPRELAQQTLQDMLEFVVVLKNLSQKSAECIAHNEFLEYLNRLIEGMSYFTEAVAHVRRIFKIGILNSVDLLEADLLSILKDLLTCQQQNEKAYQIQILTQHLPSNLEQWRLEGIPALIRCKDS